MSITIGVDLDEVLAQFLAAFVAWHNDRFGTGWQTHHFTTYDFWEIIGGTREGCIERVHQFYDSAFFADMQPVPLAQAAAVELSQIGTQHIITGRPLAIEQPTRRWVAQHFPGCFAGVHLANHFARSGETDGVRTKRELCDDVGVDVFIEDLPGYALECCSQSRPVLLVDRPWNRHVTELPPMVRRVESWQQVVEAVGELALARN